MAEVVDLQELAEKLLYENAKLKNRVIELEGKVNDMQFEMNHLQDIIEGSEERGG